MSIKELQQARQRDQQNPDKSGDFCISQNVLPTDDQRTEPAKDQHTTPKRSAGQGVHTKEKKSVHTAKVYTPTTPPEIIPDNIQQITQAPEINQQDQHTTDLLPPGLYDDITANIDYYCQQYDIQDPRKMHPHQWKSLCIYIGQHIKSRGFIRDTEREKHHGGVLYDGAKIAALLDLYDYICGQYNQVPFVYNFPRFAGISPQYLADYENRLTSSRVNLRQKALDIQKAGLVDAVTGGGSATVGNIFLSKALAGLQETVTVQHVSAAAAPVSNTLPVFGGDNPALPVSEN